MRLGVSLVVGTVVLALGAASASAQTVAPGAPTVIDGPSSSISGLGGLSIARDGTGGIVYLKQSGGSAHVFVSRLVSGSFRAPEQVDAGLAGASSEPVIAAINGGVLLVGFVNGGELYAVDRAGTAAPYTQPIGLFAGAAHPAIQATNFGKAYLAFTASGAGGHDVRAAYYYRGSWGLEPTALDASAVDDAGTGSGRPHVAASGDGVGTIVWGENGHIYARRVWATAPSVAVEQADPPSLGGWHEVSADQPVAGSGGDSSYVDVAFHETLSSGATQQSRALMNRLRGSQFDGATQPDGLTTPGGGGADDPQIVVGEYGSGLVTSERQADKQVFGTVLTGSGLSGRTMQLSSLPNTSPPDPVPAMAGLYSDLVAWQQDPGASGLPEIRVRYSNDGATFDPSVAVSAPVFGSARASSGLAAGGDIDGDAAVGFVQVGTGGTSIVVAQLYRAPGSAAPLRSFSYARTRHPVLRWSGARGRWGGISYRVSVDGTEVGQTSSTALRVPSSLGEGRHRWRVTAVNRGGEQSASRTAVVWVDTIPPSVRIKLGGTLRAGRSVHLRVSASDARPPEPPGAASGLARITVRWGDGSISQSKGRKAHVYAKPGSYTLIVVVRDRAGNKKTVIRHLTIRKH